MSDKHNLFHNIYSTPYGLNSRYALSNSTKGSKEILQRLKLQKRLPVHNGCINSICWNESGEYILSGSDDQCLCITSGYDYKVLNLMQTGHQANIFSAKFLPNTSDKKIVSCSGDGVIMYTDLQKPVESLSNVFNCHFGTAYKIVTVPGDPHSFLSCGEDGTVRWYDLRIKSCCRVDACREDILINCRRAVTALAINPTAPYQLVVGCADSSTRIFDRRMLGTRATGIEQQRSVRSLINSFTIPGSQTRSHRITSLTYSNDAQELLVSYSSEHIYLFRLKDNSDEPASVFSTNLADTEQKKSAMAPPMKRLRLRGDWSDTGPDARPEREMSQRTTLHASLMQRMSDVLTRMFNHEPVDQAQRSEQQQQRQGNEELSNDAESRESSDLHSSSEVLEPSVSYLSPVAESSEMEEEMESQSDQQNNGPANNENEQESIQPITSVVAEEGLPTENVPPTQESEPYTLEIGRPDSDLLPPDEELMGNSGELISTSQAQAADADALPSGNKIKNTSKVSSCSLVLETEVMSTGELELSEQAMDEASDATSAPGQAALNESVDNLERELSSRRQDFLNRHNVEPVINLHYSAQGSSSGLISMAELTSSTVLTTIPSTVEVASSSAPSSSRTPTSLEQPVPSTSRSRGASPRHDGIHSSSIDDDTLFVQTLTPETEEESEYQTEHYEEDLSSVEMPSGGMADNDSGLYHETESDSSSDDDNRPQATTRLRHGRNSEEKVLETSTDSESTRAKIVLTAKSAPPVVLRKFIGHRNARTMIKEANFWGDNFVISGSDCGHIFFWDRLTTEVAMVIEADKHVVNCVQPHPFDPILASSGIDYDIKLWAPLEVEPGYDLKAASEIMCRNEIMLEETRDTITVPASFMIRMLSSLSHLRSGGNPRRRSYIPLI